MSGMRAITNLVAYVWPAWQSLKAIKSKAKDDDTKWLTYWVFYGWVSTLESISDQIFFWIPFYELVKCVLYIYLWAPQTNGAMKLYGSVIRPNLEGFMEAEANSKSVLNSARMRKTD